MSTSAMAETSLNFFLLSAVGRFTVFAQANGSNAFAQIDFMNVFFIFFPVVCVLVYGRETSLLHIPRRKTERNNDRTKLTFLVAPMGAPGVRPLTRNEVQKPK